MMDASVGKRIKPSAIKVLIWPGPLIINIRIWAFV